MDDELVRGVLPQKLTELLVAQHAVAVAAAMWATGEVYAPLIQLEDLAAKLRDVEQAIVGARLEAKRVYRLTRDAQQAAGEPPEAMQGPRDVAA